MSNAFANRTAQGATRFEGVNAAAARAAAGLRLAAAPTFAVMALLIAIGGGGPRLVCSAGLSASPLSGMALMYLLMSVIHAPPWLKAFSNPRPAPETTGPTAPGFADPRAG